MLIIIAKKQELACSQYPLTVNLQDIHEWIQVFFHIHLSLIYKTK
jgi:hypothetical protein